MRYKIFKQDIAGIVQNIFHYILAIALSVVFALYINGRIGWFVTSIIAAAPVLSLLLTLLFINRVSCEYELPSAVLCKGDKYRLNIKFKNMFIFPSPPIAVELKYSVHIKCGDNILCLFIPPKSEQYLRAEFTACICGSSHIGVKRIAVKDYLGIFTFSPKSCPEGYTKISIMPDISDISPENSFIRKVIDLNAHSDDCEDTAESGILTFTGTPGYEHRAYQPGDPLKRINWKLSAKRMQLLVRLDDHISNSSVTIILDSVSDEKGLLEDFRSRCNALPSDTLRYIAEENEKCIENSLGMLLAFLKKNYSVSYCINQQNITEEFNISDESELEELRRRLASYKFSDDINSKRIPKIAEKTSPSALFCTPYADKALLNQLENADGNNSSIIVYSPQKGT